MPKIFLLVVFLSFLSCNNENEDCCFNPEQPNLIIKFKFDSLQERLNNIGQPSTIPKGNVV